MEKILRKGYAENMIIKIKEGFRVVAERGRNMGTYPSREQAEVRLRQKEKMKNDGVVVSHPGGVTTRM